MKIKTLSLFMATVAMSAMTYDQEVSSFYEYNQFLSYSDGDKGAGEIEQPTAGWNPEDVVHLMCAFVNDIHNLVGGYIVCGVAERDGRPMLPL